MSTTKPRLARTCRAEVIADAPVEAVWRVVADVTRTGEWSHECLHVRAGGAGAGCVRSWRSIRHVIAWRTIPTPLFVDSSDWRITLEPAGTGTRIVQT